MTHQQRVDAATTLLDEAYQAGQADGLAMGYVIARRIYLYWKTNNELLKPRTKEELMAWSMDNLTLLEEKKKK